MSKILLKVDEFYSSYKILLLLSIMIPIILCYFSAGNDYVFNDYQLPQTWLRNQVLVTMSSEQNATFLMKPFNVFEDNSLMIPSLSFSWKANAEAISIPDSISSPPLEQKRQDTCGSNLSVLQFLEQLMYTMKKVFQVEHSCKMHSLQRVHTHKNASILF